MKDATLVTLWAEGRSDPLVSQIPQDLAQQCLETLRNPGSQLTTIAGNKCRVLRKCLGGYEAVAYSINSDELKSKKLLELKVDTFLAAAPSIDAAIQRAEGRMQRLLHNLKSLTAKTSQEVFLLAQQDRLLGSPKESISYLASEVRENIDGTARALLEILKHQAAQKAEYIAFDQLSGRLEQVRSELHDVHRVLMNVFYLFFGELIAKKVRARVDPTRVQARFDYDSIHVCIYYIVENAAKYTRRNSDFSVTVNQNNDGLVDIRFSMESLSIKPDEREKIFEEGFSGVNAIDARLNGTGLGLYLARSMARINSGTLNVIPGSPLLGGQYSRNTFVLTLPGG